MELTVNVKNFGKIQDAKVRLAPFSVIAGSNSSGKSFLTRALYSVFSTINKDYITQEARQLLSPVKHLLRYGFISINSPSQKVDQIHFNLMEIVELIDESIGSALEGCTLLEQHAISLMLEDKIKSAEDLCEQLQKEIANKKKYEEFEKRLKVLSRNLKILKSTIKNPVDVLSRRLSTEFSNSLKENFQISTLSELKSHSAEKDESIRLEFDELGVIVIDKEHINFSLNQHSIAQFQELHNVVFVESPIYWKLRKPLLDVRLRQRNSLFSFKKDEQFLLGVPKFFYDLMDLLDVNLKLEKNTNNFQEIIDNLNQTLSGEIEISENGELFFKDEKTLKNINLNITATGVTNLGVIGLLLKKNVISKGSFVFIDEPEVNLHPAWQKIMIETLYELSRMGINVVIATHSIDMVRYIENIMNDLTEEEVNAHFAINRLSNEGVSLNEYSDPKTSLYEIKNDLGDSYYNMIMESGW